MGQFASKLRMTKGFGNNNHKCPTPIGQSTGDSSGSNTGSTTSAEANSANQQPLTLKAEDELKNSDAPPRAEETIGETRKVVSSSALSASASTTKRFRFDGTNFNNAKDYTISPTSTLSNQNFQNLKIKLSWVDPKLSNQSTPSIDCDFKQDHLKGIEDLINEINDIYVSYTSNHHIKLLLAGNLCDTIYLVSENKLVMNLTSVDMKDINRDLVNNMTIVSDLTDEFKDEKEPICKKMTDYFTEKIKTFAKIILIMNYCYLKLKSIKEGGLCYMPPDDGMDEFADNFNLFTPSSKQYDKIEVYDNELVTNSTLTKHIDTLNIRDKLLLPNKNFKTIRAAVLKDLFNSYDDKILSENDETIKDKLRKIKGNDSFLTSIELIHERDCTTDRGSFILETDIANYGLYNDDASNIQWINAYKTLCCIIKDKLIKLKEKFIPESFKEKTVEKKGKKEGKTSWSDKEMSKERIDELHKEITEEIEKIIIEIDRGFLQLYLMPTKTPAIKMKEDEILRRAKIIEAEREKNAAANEE
jgi:hypothetical protein